MATTRPYNQDCAIARTLDMIGDRWTLLIIRDLFLGRARFSEFLHSMPAPPPRLLSQRLRRLEEDGLVARAVHDEYPVRTEYQLTAKGRSLFPVLYAMGSWGLEHLFEDDPELAGQLDDYLESAVPEYRQMKNRRIAQPEGV